MSKHHSCLVALLLLSQSAFAQQTPPGAGGQFQQIPPPPVQQRPLPDIRVEPGRTPAQPDDAGLRVRIDALQIAGQTVYSEAQLLSVADFKPGGEWSLADLRAMVTRISDYYHRNGYFVAQAYLPAQDIRNGAVRIEVIEGQYGRIELRNSTNLSDGLANGLLGGLNRGDIIAAAPLEERLLLLSDIPGVNVRSTLVPGASVGASDLIVDVTPGRRVTGSVDADNAGNRYTGENRIGATVNLNNPTGHGDVASLRVLTSGPGLTYGRASYQTQIGRATVGAAYTGLQYRLGKEFASLQAHGTAEIASIYGSYPLIRSRNTNLYGLLAFDAKTFQDKVDTTSTVTDKKARVLMASLNGDHRDRIGGGGFSAYSLTWTTGVIDILTPAALAADAATAQSNGHFNKLSYHALRLQTLSAKWSLLGAIRGQFASKNLDISEKMELGGMNGVRAYPEGEAYADEGYIVNLEARYLLPKFSQRMPGQMHLIGFVDTGSVTLRKNNWAGGDNHRTLSGTGVGLTWMDYNNFSLRAYYAVKLGSGVATSAPDKNGRFWIQAIKYF